jgi:hypothetical protein
MNQLLNPKTKNFQNIFSMFVILIVAVFGFVFSARGELQVAGRHL